MAMWKVSGYALIWSNGSMAIVISPEGEVQCRFVKEATQEDPKFREEFSAPLNVDARYKAIRASQLGLTVNIPEPEFRLGDEIKTPEEIEAFRKEAVEMTRKRVFDIDTLQWVYPGLDRSWPQMGPIRVSETDRLVARFQTKSGAQHIGWALEPEAQEVAQRGHPYLLRIRNRVPAEHHTYLDQVQEVYLQKEAARKAAEEEVERQKLRKELDLD